MDKSKVVSDLVSKMATIKDGKILRRMQKIVVGHLVPLGVKAEELLKTINKGK